MASVHLSGTNSVIAYQGDAAFQVQGMDPAWSTPEDFRRLVAQDAERWARVIRTANIKAD